MLVKYNNNNVGRKAHTTKRETMDKEIKLLNQIEDLIYDVQVHKMSNQSIDPFLNTLENFRNEVLEQIKFLEALEDKQKEINNAINIIDKIYFLEEEKWNDYNNDYDEFKNDIPKLEKQLDLLIKFKKYLKNYNK